MGSSSIVLLGLDIQIWLLVVQILTLIGLFVYVVKTWEMASATRRSVEISEKALQELRDTRDEETAPYVVAYFEVQDHFRLLLIVKNTGKTMATNVKVTFELPFAAPYQDGLAKVLSPNGIPSLPPNYAITIVIGPLDLFRQSGPMEYTAKVDYCGGSSSRPRTAMYVLDLGMFRDFVSAGTVLY